MDEERKVKCLGANDDINTWTNSTLLNVKDGLTIIGNKAFGLGLVTKNDKFLPLSTIGKFTEANLQLLKQD